MGETKRSQKGHNGHESQLEKKRWIAGPVGSNDNAYKIKKIEKTETTRGEQRSQGKEGLGGEKPDFV